MSEGELVVRVGFKVRGYEGAPIFLVGHVMNGLKAVGIDCPEVWGIEDPEPRIKLLSDERNAAVWEAHRLKCGMATAGPTSTYKIPEPEQKAPEAKPGPDGFLWQLFEYGDDDVRLQRVCDAKGCDKGLIYAPVRNCSTCGGTGFRVRRFYRPLDPVDVDLGTTDPVEVTLNFGKHRGERISKIPEAYLAWMIREEVPQSDDAKAELARRGS